MTALNGAEKNIILEKDIVVTQSLEAKEDKVIDMAGHSLEVFYAETPDNNEEVLRFTIPAGKNVSIQNSSDSFSEDDPKMWEMPVVNYGTCSIYGIPMASQYDSVISNYGTCNVDYTYLVGQDTVLFSNVNAVVYNNSKEHMFTMSNAYIFSSNTVKPEYSFYNAGGAVQMQSTRIYAKELNVGIYNAGDFFQRDSRVAGENCDHGIGVLNKGRYIMTMSSISGVQAGMVCYDGGKFVMNEGFIGRCQYGVMTNPAIEAEVQRKTGGSVTSGSFVLNQGMVSGYTNSGYDALKYGVAYTDSIPILAGGEVRATDAAVAKFQGTSFQTLQGKFLNGEKQETAAVYTDAFGTKKDAYAIVSGIVEGNDRDEKNVSGGIRIEDTEAFQSAVQNASTDALRPTVLYLMKELVFDENIIIPEQKQLIIRLYPNENSSAIRLREGKQLLIKKAAGVWLDGAATAMKMNLEAASGVSPVVNEGTLVLKKGVTIQSAFTVSSNKLTNIIENKGNLSIEGAYITSNDTKNARLCCLLHNTAEGTVNAEGGRLDISYGTNAISNNGIMNLNMQIRALDTSNEIGNGIYNAGIIKLGKDTQLIAEDIGIYNTSSAEVICGGYIRYATFGVAYEQNAMPQMGENSKIRGNKYAIAAADPTKPVSEWKAGKFRNLLNGGVETDSEGVCLIDNCVLCYSTDNLMFQTRYLQMNPGETLQYAEDLLNKPDYRENSRGKDKLFLSCSDNEILEVNTVSVNGNVRTELKAKKKGYTTLQMRTAAGVEDFIRIEVTDQTARTALTSRDFEGNLLETDIEVNAYRKKTKIPFGFHLKSSKEDISVGTDAGEVIQETLVPGEIIIRDSKFQKYYQVCDLESEEYSFSIAPRLEEGIPKVLDDEVGSIDNVDVYLRMASRTGVMTEDMIKIGTMNLSIDKTQPVITFQTITLYSAYNSNSSWNHAQVWRSSNSPELNSGDLKGTVSGIVPKKNFSLTDSCLSYTGTAKNTKASLPVRCVLDNYYGSFESVIPVKVIGTRPKATLMKSTIQVTGELEKSIPIALGLKSGDYSSLDTLKSAEIVGTSSFIVQDGSSEITKQKNYENPSAFYLSAVKEIQKPETVTLRLSYANTKEYNGKPYFTTVKVKIKPVKRFSIKPEEKVQTLDPIPYVQIDGTTKYDEATFRFVQNPSNYIGAAVVVTGLNGLQLVGNVNSYTGEFSVRAKKGMDTSKPITITVKWIEAESDTLLASTKVKVKFADKQKLEIKTSKVTMKLNQKAVYYGDLRGNTYYILNDKNEINASTSGPDDTICIEATNDQFAQKISLKESGTFAKTGTITVDDNRFKVGLWRATPSKKVVWSPYIQPNLDKLNLLVPGKDYTVNITRTDEVGLVVTKSVIVHIADYKEVKTGVNQKTVTLYKQSPYYEVKLGVKPLNPATERIVSITPNDSNYSVRRVEKKYDASFQPKGKGYSKNKYEMYYLYYTGHRSTKITGSAYEKPVNLTLTVTYASGKTGTVTVKVINK